MDMRDYDFNTPLSPIRFQSQLGKEVKRMYKEGNNIVKLSLARVSKVNYKYNTVEVITTLHKNTTMKNPSDNGRFSARLPVTFGGRTPDGKVYGTNTLVTVGSLVLIGFLEGSKDNPIVLNVYGDADNQSQLTRTTLTSADESDEAVQQELWQLFSLYPSMTYRNIDGRGNQEVTFSGKSFMYITDTDPDNEYVQDGGFDYADLPSSRYANGELIEPTSPNSPTLLYVHQGVYDKHRVTFFIKSDGTVRLASRHLNGKGITYQELKTDGSFGIVQKRDTTNPEEDSQQMSKVEIDYNGNVNLQGPGHKLEITKNGVFVDGKLIGTFGGGDSGALDDLQKQLGDVKTSITVMDGKIETKVEKSDFNIDTTKIDQAAEETKADTLQRVNDLQGALGSLKVLTDTAYQDGTIGTTESMEIDSELTKVSQRLSSLNAKYLEISSSMYLTDANKTTLEAAKADLDDKYEELVTTISVVGADGAVNSTERAAVNTAINNMMGSTTDLYNALIGAIDVITSARIKEAAANPMSYLDGEVRNIGSTITQLADSVTTKVESITFTNAIQDINATKATKEETQIISDRLDEAEQEIVDAVQNLPYRVEVLSTNGLVFKNGDIESTVYCKVYRGTEEVTHTLGPDNFIWTRISDDSEGDAAWNAAHVGVGPSFNVTPADVPTRATFECALFIEQQPQ
jgi:hypothetical protein